jgi:hypothetical protein
MTTQGRLRRRPSMPDLPQRDDQVVLYLPQLDRAVVDIYGDLAELLQFHTALAGQATFGAAVTIVNVLFDSTLEDQLYQPTMTPSWDTRLWVTSILATGFTINASTAPGGAGGTVYWTVSR